MPLPPPPLFHYRRSLVLAKSQTVVVTDGLLFPQTLLRRLATEDDDAAAPQTLLKCFGQSPGDYCVNVLKKVFCLCSFVADGTFSSSACNNVDMFPIFQRVALLQQNAGKSCALLDTRQR